MITRGVRLLCLFACLVPLAVAAQAQTAPVVARITAPVDENSRVTLRGNTHPLARPQNDQGPAQASLPMQRMLLVLKRSPDQETALDELLEQQQDHSSSNYHRWLTPQEFGQRFGPADQDIQTVTSWLQSHGFGIERVSNGRTIIEFSGNASQVQQAFHTAMHMYAVNGEVHYANATDPQIPVALASVVAGVRSLHNFFAKPTNHPAGIFYRDKDTGRILRRSSPAPPQFQPGGASRCGVDGHEPCEPLGPYDLATIYNIKPLWSANTPIDGTGQTIAIVGETDINPADWTAFWNMFGVTNPKGEVNLIYNGPDPGSLKGEEAEADIDTQWSSAVAQGATIDLVISQSTETTQGVDLSAEYIVDNNLAGVMSESYGECELFSGATGNTFLNSLWQQASAEGITVSVSSGDGGSAGCDQDSAYATNGLAVNAIASTPFNVAVGGTDFNDLTTTASYWGTQNDVHEANALSYIPEMTWNDSCTNQEFFSLLLNVTDAEQACNNAPQYAVVTAGSGGKSSCTISNGQSPLTCSGGYPKPSWQTGNGVPNDGRRDLPDVSFFASNGFNDSFYIVCESDDGGPCSLSGDDFLGFGGTSVSAPVFAGVMALVDQETGERQGNANYVLYKMASTAGNTCNSNTALSNGLGNCIFYDIPEGSTIAMACASGSPNCTTLLPGDQLGVLTGFDTTSGYDMATGLGSVNVSNLVSAWSTYSGQFESTDFSSFTLGPPTTFTHGASVPVSATIAPRMGSGTPTGTITLMAGQRTIPKLFALSNASIVPGATTNLLPGGTYSVTAHYSGDGTFAPSSSSPQTVTINPEASESQPKIVTFDASTGGITSNDATSFPYGSIALLRTDITNATGSDCVQNELQAYGCPTGSVSLTDTFNSVAGALGPGTYALNTEGFAEDQSISFLGGQHTIAAVYGGDASYMGSSGTNSINVTPASTVTQKEFLFTGSVVLGNTAVLYFNTGTVTLGDFDVAPTGTFLLYDGSTQIPVQVSSSTTRIYPANVTSVFYANIGVNLSFTIPGPIGTHTLTCFYTGDANYQTSTSAPFTMTVAYGSATTVTSDAPTYIAGQNATFAATVKPNVSGGPTPTGTILFGRGIIQITVPLVNGQAQFTTAALPLGSQEVSATYSGDANYATSVGTVTVTVNPAPIFSSTANPNTIVISSPGGSGSTTITFTSMNGFAGTIPLSPSLCANLPTQSSCTFGANSVTLQPNQTATVSLTITTTGPSTSPQPSGAFPILMSERRSGQYLLVAGLLSLSFLFFAGSRTLKRRGLALSLAALGLILAMTSCAGGGNAGGGNNSAGNGGSSSGSGSGNSGTPTGLYPGIVVTFSGAGLTPAPNVTVSVNVE